MQNRSWNAIFIFFFFLLLILRLATGLGALVHFDEPFWMARGDFLFQTLSEGNWEALQESHWSVQGEEGQRTIFNSYIGNGFGTAFLTGFGRLFMELFADLDDIDQVLIEIFLSRLFHIACSVLTPLLLLMLAGRLGLSRIGQLWFFLYLIFDPIFLEMGSRAHLESFLTFTIPVALMLYALGHKRDSLILYVLSGIVFGLAFATRVNAAVVMLAALAYSAIQIFFSRQSKNTTVCDKGEKEIIRFLLFCMVGWVVFIVCFPPLWTTPFFGFADFLYQKASLVGGDNLRFGSRLEVLDSFHWTESKLRFSFLLLSIVGFFFKPVRSSRGFQLGALLLVFGVIIVSFPEKFYSRYLASCLPGLALMGSSTIAYVLTANKQWVRRLNRLSIVAMLIFFTLLACSITLDRLSMVKQVRKFYGILNDQDFSRIEVPSLSSAFLQTDVDHTGPTLFLRGGYGGGSHVQLFYLGVVVTDLRRFHQLGSGWTRESLENSFPCGRTDWQLGRPWARDVTRLNGMQLGELTAWQCKE